MDYGGLRETTGNYGGLRGTTGDYGRLRATTRDYGRLRPWFIAVAGDLRGICRAHVRIACTRKADRAERAYTADGGLLRDSPTPIEVGELRCRMILSYIIYKSLCRICHFTHFE